MKKLALLCSGIVFSLIVSLSINAAQPSTQPALWQVYQRSLKSAKYVDLTHTIAPSIPVWSGFALPKFTPTVSPKTGEPYTYEENGVSVGQIPESPLPKANKSLHWDQQLGVRIR